MVVKNRSYESSESIAIGNLVACFEYLLAAFGFYLIPTEGISSSLELTSIPLNLNLGTFLPLTAALTTILFSSLNSFSKFESLVCSL